MPSSTSRRRGVYFAFQGLLTAVLLLLFTLRPHGEQWLLRLVFLAGAFAGSLTFIQLAPRRLLDGWWVQMGLFVADSALASLTLHWTSGDPTFFLLYFLIILGTALSRSPLQSFVVVAATSVLFVGSAWHPLQGFPQTPEFWLRLHFLWITAILLAVLSQDSQQAQKEADAQYRDRVAQLESLAALGRVAGEVAHRIKGPLTTIRVNAEVLSHRVQGPPEVLRELAEIQEEVDRCKAILKDLLSLGRIEEIDLSRLDLREPLRAALRSIQPQLRSRGLRLRVRGLRRRLDADGDTSMLYEAFLAVLQNAVDAASKEGRIEVEARTSVRRRGWWLPLSARRVHAVTVRDDGAGIDRRDLGRVFRPFFTTKPGEGSGMGLSAALRILQKHGGTIEAASDGPGRGAAFTLTIDEADGTAGPAAAPKA